MKQTVNPRIMWPHEAKNFTPWLSENISLVNGVLGLHLTLPVCEHTVGRYRADLVAMGDAGHKVVIEAQLGTSDHSHLGQCLTYAACLGADTIIWIATAFTSEHLKALELLNMRNTLFCYAVTFSFGQVDTFYTPCFLVICRPQAEVWTKGAAVARIQMSAYLQQALYLEPRLHAVIDDAIAQENVMSYQRIHAYYMLKRRIGSLVGVGADRSELRTSEHFDAVITAIYDLLPADNTENFV